MSKGFAASAALGCSMLWLGCADAQTTGIRTNPDGSLSGSVSMPGQPGLSVGAGGGQVTTHAWGAPDQRQVTTRSRDGSSSTTVTAGPNGRVWSGGAEGVACPDGAAVTVTSGPEGTHTSCGASGQGVWATAGDGEAHSGVIASSRAPQGVAYTQPRFARREVVQHTRVRHFGRAHHHRRHRA